MKTRIGLVMIIALLLVIGLAAAIIAAENEKGETGETGNSQVVTFDQLPAAVQATLKHQVGAGKINEIEKETENGQVVYSSDVTKADGKNYDVVIGENGNFIRAELEKPGESEANEEAGEGTPKPQASNDVTFNQLPKAVQKTLKREVGKGKINGIEKETENGHIVYSADVTKVDGKNYDVVIAANGHRIRTELEKPGETEGTEGGATNEKGETGEAGERE